MTPTQDNRECGKDSLGCAALPNLFSFYLFLIYKFSFIGGAPPPTPPPVKRGPTTNVSQSTAFFLIQKFSFIGAATVYVPQRTVIYFLFINFLLLGGLRPPTHPRQKGANDLRSLEDSVYFGNFMIGKCRREYPKSFLSTLNEKKRNSVIGSVFGNSEIWHPTAESADDFGDFTIRIGRRDRPKSFLPTLNGEKVEIRPSGRFSEIRRFGIPRPNRLTISVILWFAQVVGIVLSRFCTL